MLGIIIVLAGINYRNVAVYDAHLYYGAYVKAFELFEQNIRTAIGSFILWGHVFVGTALFLAPIETLMMGEMYGVYIGNTILFCVTLVILYKLLEEYFAKPNNALAVISTRASNGGNLKIYHLVNSFFG